MTWAARISIAMFIIYTTAVIILLGGAAVRAW